METLSNRFIMKSYPKYGIFKMDTQTGDTWKFNVSDNRWSFIKQPDRTVAEADSLKVK
jgi:hypothetical protein